MKRQDSVHFEEVYLYIAEIVDYNYLLFRTIVWGGAILLFQLAVKRLNLPFSLVLFFFATLCLTRFSYARASLAMAIAFLGFSYLIKPSKVKIVSFCWGIVIVTCSLFFHKSALFIIPIYLLSIFPLTKKIFYIILLLYPFVVLAFFSIGIEYVLSSSDDIAGKALGYMDAEKKENGVGALIRIILVRTPFYVMLLMIILSVLKGKYQQMKAYEQHIINVVFYTICGASIFFFKSEYNTNIIYYRLLYYAILPISITFCIFKVKNYYPRLLKLAFIIGLAACLYEMSYSYYIALIERSDFL